MGDVDSLTVVRDNLVHDGFQHAVGDQCSASLNHHLEDRIPGFFHRTFLSFLIKKSILNKQKHPTYSKVFLFIIPFNEVHNPAQIE
jgi:hypothetical protein